MDNKKLFTHKSDDYSRFRPSYPKAAVDWLRAEIQGERVVDIGAGTGIFTKLLLSCFQNVSAVEPNEEMRNKFLFNLPGILCSDGCGEATKLPERSVDLITVAQAFHWLDEEKFKAEALRILAPEGKVAIIWNTSLRTEFTEARDEVCRKYCPRFRSGHAGKRNTEEGDTFLRNVYFRQVQTVSFHNPFAMDIQTFEGNMRSRSYALIPGMEDYEAFREELRAVFNRYAVNGIVVEPQETQIYSGCF